MKYHYQYGVEKDKKGGAGVKFGLLAVVLLAISGYVGFLAVLPATGGWIFSQKDEVAQKMQNEQPGTGGDALYIPKLNITVPQGGRYTTFEGQVAEKVRIIASALSIQITPQQTLAASPFARLNQLQEGDELFLDQSETRYAYKVITSEADATLQLQTEDGKQKIFAKKVGEVTWQDNKPSLQLDN